MRRSSATVAAVLVLWMALAAPHLQKQFHNTEKAWTELAGLSLEERSVRFHGRSVPLAQELAAAVPANECVLVLAYAGPSARDFYRQRLPYDLYPRRIHVVTNPRAEREGCSYLAVFRDSPANLNRDPFKGRWNERELNRRLQPLDQVTPGDTVDIYRAQ